MISCVLSGTVGQSDSKSSPKALRVSSEKSEGVSDVKRGPWPQREPQVHKLFFPMICSFFFFFGMTGHNDVVMNHTYFQVIINNP
jgi:hypothetical protein